MLKSFANALFPQIHTQSNYDFKAREARDRANVSSSSGGTKTNKDLPTGKGQLSDSPIEKPNSKHAAMGLGERTKKGAPAPGQGSKPNVEIGEPSEPSEMSPEQKKQLGGSEPTFDGKQTKPKL